MLITFLGFPSAIGQWVPFTLVRQSRCALAILLTPKTPNSLRRPSTPHQILFPANPTSTMTSLSSSLIPARTNHCHRTRNCSQSMAKMPTATTRTKRNHTATRIFSWEISTHAAAGQMSRSWGRNIFEMGGQHLPEGISARRRALFWSVDLPLVHGHSSSCIFASTRAYKTFSSSSRSSSSPA